MQIINNIIITSIYLYKKKILVLFYKNTNATIFLIKTENSALIDCARCRNRNKRYRK